MDKNKAIVWAVQALADVFQYEFYQNMTQATHAADAMTILSGQPWIAVKRVNGIQVQPEPKEAK